MAMKNCFQVSSIATARDTALHADHPFSSKERLNLQACKGLIISPRYFALSSNRRYHSSHIICKAREAMNEVQVVTDSSWNNLVVASESPVLVEFTAEWCGPCKLIAPVIEELAKEYAGKILCYKLNTDESPNIASQYGIRSIPTVLFFKDGEKKQGIVGAVPKSTLEETIEKYLDI